MASRLGRSRLFLNSRSIALYLPADGEMDTAPLLALARRLKRRCFLPVLRGAPHYSLWFAEYRPGDPLRPNRFGILEPALGRRKILPAWGLDLILLPLVGFDQAGNRLGMGGGYYDRTLAFLHRRLHWRRPRLIGLAHECQRVERLAAKPWDVPLDGVATEACIHRWRRRPGG
jgi:5-formyltetrahydrofolate cyclo-ligase